MKFLHLLLIACLAGIFLTGFVMAIEINIGTNNSVNTGTISGDGCKHGSGKIGQQERKIAPFRAVVIDGSFSVRLTGADAYGLVVSGDDNLLEHIKTGVSGDTLTITSSGSFCTTTPMTITISTKGLDKIAADGATDITADLRTLSLKALAVELNGTCSLRAQGKTQQLQVSLQGTAELDATALPSDKVTVMTKDATVAKLSVGQLLSGASHDASEIHYLGKPQVQVNVQDVSEVSPLE